MLMYWLFPLLSLPLFGGLDPVMFLMFIGLAIIISIVFILRRRANIVGVRTYYREVVGNYIAVIWDLSENTLDIRGMERVSGDLFMTHPSQGEIAFITVPSSRVQPFAYKVGDTYKPAYLVAMSNLVGVAVNPESLARLGIVNIYIDLVRDEANWVRKSLGIAESMLREIGEVTGFIPLTPKLKLGLVFRPGEGEKTLLLDIINASSSMTDVLAMAYEKADKLREFKELEIQRVSAITRYREVIFKYLALFLILGGMLYIIARMILSGQPPSSPGVEIPGVGEIGLPGSITTPISQAKNVTSNVTGTVTPIVGGVVRWLRITYRGSRKI